VATPAVDDQPPLPADMAVVASEVVAGPGAVDTPTPYVEDVVEPEREYASLSLPVTSLRKAHRTGRAIIGTEPARTYDDLALIPSLLRAAWFKHKRWDEGIVPEGEFILMATDLRSYRRGPAPERMLCIVFDHTSVRAGGGQELMVDVLLQGYRERAPVVLIQVGASDELRARAIKARSVLVPYIWDALAQPAGKATPLAHGLRLAYESILRATQHGRAAAQSVRLVVVTDGRGNVPLRMSRTGVVDETVGRDGLDDAFAEARRLRTLKHVHSMMLSTRPSEMVDLPAALAAAMGATYEMANVG